MAPAGLALLLGACSALPDWAVPVVLQPAPDAETVKSTYPRIVDIPEPPEPVADRAVAEATAADLKRQLEESRALLNDPNAPQDVPVAAGAPAP
ncbi:MAG: hypothetical protein H6923_09280 [Alphaproteobacteria bacterium]|nr:hypothetical protein [Alphaproteobacteria bacterium]